MDELLLLGCPIKFMKSSSTVEATRVSREAWRGSATTRAMMVGEGRVHLIEFMVAEGGVAHGLDRLDSPALRGIEKWGWVEQWLRRIINLSEGPTSLFYKGERTYERELVETHRGTAGNTRSSSGYASCPCNAACVLLARSGTGRPGSNRSRT